jgi:hypothetical protein
VSINLLHQDSKFVGFFVCVGSTNDEYVQWKTSSTFPIFFSSCSSSNKFVYEVHLILSYAQFSHHMVLM